jgi:hypothetical protein
VIFENGDTRTVSKSTGMKWYQNQSFLFNTNVLVTIKIPLRQRVNPSKLVVLVPEGNGSLVNQRRRANFFSAANSCYMNLQGLKAGLIYI